MDMKLCGCGCGGFVNSKDAEYIKGHHLINKLGHNKGNRYTIREDCNKKVIGLSEEHRRKIGLKSKGHKTSEHQKELLRKAMRGNKKCGRSGVENPFYGKTHTEETKRIIGLKSKMGYKVSGEKNPQWRGGISFEPYSKEFNRQLKYLIRVRDGFTCQLCGMPERENGRILPIHHIDYDKHNSMPTNLISLCISCNTKVNMNRDYWTNYFRELLNKRQLNPKALAKKRQKNKPEMEILKPVNLGVNL